MADLDGGPPAGVERRGTGGWDSVLETEAYRVTPGGEWRKAGQAVAIARVAEAARLRSIYP